MLDGAFGAVHDHYLGTWLRDTARGLQKAVSLAAVLFGRLYIKGSRLLVEGAQEAIASAIWAGKGEADFLDGETCGIRSLGSMAARLEKLSWKFRFRACGTSTRAHVVRAGVTKSRE